MLAYMNEARERRRAGGIFEDEPKEPEAIEREPFRGRAQDGERHAQP